MQTAFALSGRAGLSVRDAQSLAREAEEAGYSHVFATESSNDALALAAAMATATTRVVIGTSILNLTLRHPFQLAMTAAVVDDQSGGRLWLGLGVGDRPAAKDKLGMDPGPPLATVRDYVHVVRAGLAGSVDHDGEVFKVSGASLTRAAQHPVEIHVAALQPGMLRVAGTVGDGAILHLTSPEGARHARGIVDESAAAAGRDPAEVVISCMVPVCVQDDPEAALESARSTVLRYARHPVASQVFAATGHGEQIAAIGARLGEDDEPGARSLVDPRLARSFVAHGSVGQCREQINAYRDAGVDLPIVFPMPSAADDWPTSLWRGLPVIGPPSPNG